MGFAGDNLRPRGRLGTLVQNVLPHLTSLRSLDLGQDTGIGLANPQMTLIHSRLAYLRLSLQDMAHLYHVMSSNILSATLEQFHVTMRSHHPLCEKIFPRDLRLPPMMKLHTFSLFQTILSDNRIEWSTIESVTDPNHMPVLRQVNLAIFITVNDLYRINGSSLFTDHRRIDVQFAFIIDNHPSGVQLSHLVPHQNRLYSRQVVGVTCVVSKLSTRYRHLTDISCHVSISISHCSNQKLTND